MFFIQYIQTDGRYSDASGYICTSLDEVKSVLKDIFLYLNNGDLEDENGNNFAWTSLNDAVDIASSFEEISNIVYEFACGSGTTFRFNDVVPRGRIELIS
jgi:hypothetical protein